MTKEGILQNKKIVEENRDIINIMVMPFCDKTPLFLSKKFFKRLNLFKKLHFEYIIFPFYVQTIYIKQVAGVVLHKGKVVSIFGEGFSNKSAVIFTCGIKIKVVFHYDLFSLQSDFSSFDYIFGIDDEELYNEQYVLQKTSNKLLFFPPQKDNYHVVIKKGKIISKNFAKLL